MEQTPEVVRETYKNVQSGGVAMTSIKNRCFKHRLHQCVFVLKRITFATVTPIVYTTPAFSTLETETFENAADPVLV